MVQQYSDVLVAGTFNATSTAGLLATRALSLLTTYLNTVPQNLYADPTTGALKGIEIWGFRLTNNDPAATLYLSFLPNLTGVAANTNDPSLTNYFHALPPGAYIEISAGTGIFNRLKIVSTGASTAAQLTVFI